MTMSQAHLPDVWGAGQLLSTSADPRMRQPSEACRQVDPEQVV